MLNIILVVIGIASALINLALIAIRLVESINELKKTPEIDTLQEIIQVVKNFFKVETYK